jgi:hypothetical protein
MGQANSPYLKSNLFTISLVRQSANADFGYSSFADLAGLP